MATYGGHRALYVALPAWSRPLHHRASALKELAFKLRYWEPRAMSEIPEHSRNRMIGRLVPLFATHDCSWLDCISGFRGLMEACGDDRAGNKVIQKLH